MKHHFFQYKSIMILLTALCLSSSPSILPLTASTIPNSTSKSPSSDADTNKVPPSEKPMHRPPNCKCKLPFRRFIAALEKLEQDKQISKDDFAKVMDALHQIPRETLNKVEDKDQAVADALYKDKVLTDTQYKKITELLKSTAKKN